jgi:3-mercaptopyruvate sulfurtransferase SseA
MIGQLGINGSGRVFVYEDGELMFASRIRFLLAHFGPMRISSMADSLRCGR